MRWKSWSVLVVVVAGFASLFGPRGTGWTDVSAVASDKTVLALQSLAEKGGRLQRLKAIDDLRKLDSDDAHTALEALADSKDEQLAAFALSAVARCDYSGARTKLEAVFESANRSGTARSFALTYWCGLRAKQGAAWSDLKSYVDEKCGSNDALKDTAACVKKAQFDGQVR